MYLGVAMRILGTFKRISRLGKANISIVIVLLHYIILHSFPKATSDLSEPYFGRRSSLNCILNLTNTNVYQMLSLICQLGSEGYSLQDSTSKAINELGPLLKDKEKSENRIVKKEGVQSILTYLYRAVSRITVEPVTFCYACAMILHAPIIQQYVYHRISIDAGLPTTIYNSEVSACDDEGSETSLLLSSVRKEVQSKASYVHLGVVLSASIPSVFMALLLGSWSDMAGRKVVMIMPVIGGTFEALFILVTMYANLPLYMLFCGSFVNGFCGFFTTMILAVFSYIADVTEESQRAFRLGILEAIAFVSGMTSHLTSGWWIKHLGFKAPYWFILGLHTFTLFYLTLALPESRPPSKRRSLKDLFSKVHIQNIITLFRKPRTHKRWQLMALIITSALMMLSSIGFGSVIVLYALDSPFCCSPIMIGYFLAESMLIQAIGAMFGFLVLRKIISETTLTQIGIFSIIGSLVMMAFIKKRLLMFVVPFVGCLGGVCMPIIRARMSKLVDPNEQGALFAAVATLETLCTLSGAAIFNSLYPFSVKEMNFKGFCFLVMAFIMTIPSIITSLLGCAEREEDVTATSKGKGDDDSSSECLRDKTLE